MTIVKIEENKRLSNHLTARAQGYCDQMRGQHLNPFRSDLQHEDFLDWIQGHDSARVFEETFSDEMADGRG